MRYTVNIVHIIVYGKLYTLLVFRKTYFLDVIFNKIR